MRRLFLTISLCLYVAFAWAETLSEALEAGRRGDFAAAYPLWVELAETGDDKAMVEVGLMYHLGRGVNRDYTMAMDWYLKAFRRNGDAVNNIGVIYRDGLGVAKNRKIAYLLFLTVHMTGMGNQTTVSRANRNLRREIAELPLSEREEAICYTMEYLIAYVEAKGDLDGIPENLRASPARKRIKALDWWLPGEVGEFDCPPNT
ncbi:MAG: sel1 repeat family protein [Gammaproteobacteria bacterium]|nr:sel1 repeat family protein [Gammaproteobacteria bacterium]MDH3378117.1 sel1 repeat family protein [Gammaproteobacteria bacterium]